MEFKLINPKSENGFIQNIEFNFEELKTELELRLDKYNNLTYSESEIKNAKDDKAGLNKFKEAIETRRKEIKKLCLKPYDDFEKKIKELTGLIDKPIIAIDTQLKNYEEQRKTAKRQDILDFYNSSIGDLAELLPFDRIYNEKWLNATVKMTTITKEIVEIIGQVNGNLNIISDLKLDSDMEFQVKDRYLQTLDFGLAMAEKTRLENVKKAIKERETIQEVQIDQEEHKPSEMDEQIMPVLENIIEEEPQKEEIKKYTRKFWVKGTKEQLISLGEYLKANNIQYGGIE